MLIYQTEHEVGRRSECLSQKLSSPPVMQHLHISHPHIQVMMCMSATNAMLVSTNSCVCSQYLLVLSLHTLSEPTSAESLYA